MKKLMFAAAGAAMGLSASAVRTPEAYEMNITLKTMTCKAGEGKNVCDNDYTTYRVKANQKIAGLFWGCDCQTIAEPKAFETFDDFGTENSSHGYVFWDASDKTKPAYETASFVWADAAGEFDNFLQCVNPKCSEVEGVWTLQLSGMRKTDCEDPTAEAELAPVVALQGAGVGASRWNENHLAAYVNNMSGNVTGWAFPGILSGGCAACGEVWAGCSAWAFCTECEENDCNMPSAAYGTWTLKFNLAVAKKYGNATSKDGILKAYKFSDKVKAYLIETDEGQEPEVTECDKAKANVAKIEAEIKGYTDAIATAQDAVNATTAAVNKAWAEYNNPKTSALWIAGTNDTAKALAAYFEKKGTFKAMCEMKVYADIATNAAVVEAGTNYWNDAQTYLKAAAQLDADLRTDTNTVNILKAKVANDYLLLENAISKVAAGESTKATLKAALQACYDAAEVYFNTAVKYVYLYTFPEALKDMPNYDTVSAWTKKQLKAVYDAAQAEQNTKKADLSAAQTAWNSNSVRLNAELGTAQAYQKAVCD